MDISNVTYSVGESTAQNSIANTVLKTLVLPRAAKSPPNCNWSLTTQNFRLYVPNDFVEVGFPQREWMTRLLPKALDASTLRFKLNATNTSTDVRNGELPMSASLAADLVVNAMFMSSEFIPWGKYKSWNDPVPTNITEAYPTSKSQKHRQVPTAELLELLPAGPEVSESAKKKWLLEAIEPVLSSKFADSDQFSLKDIGVEFAHIEVSPNITFDALTFELDVNTSLITNATNAADGTRYTLLSSSNCAPWPDRCLIPKAVMPPEGTVNYDLLYDAPAQVNAFAVCVNSDGSETIESTIFFNESDMIDYNMQSCSNSMSSILLISVSKRLVASALISDVTGDFDGLHSEAYSSVATNLRKIYSFTVNWKIVDLAKEYKASCKVDGGNCFGLSIELNASNSTPDQRLVAGVEALPLNLLSAPLYSGKLHDEGQRPFTLIQVNEPPRQSILGDWYSIVAGDILLPHNVMLDRWELGQVDYSEQLCAHQEDRIELVLNNHYYMEHTLQATYTSALFFLMQNGVPTDTVPLDQKTTTLAFSANKQNIVVWISAPKLNAVLTYVGCLVLVVAIVTMLLIQNNGSLLGITAPHAIARVVLDGKTFPSFLLYRKVKFTSENAGGVYDVDNVVINTISVQPAKNASDLIEDSRTSNNSRDLRSV
ncbi:Hypothetical protein PHPALM_18643 [Phytophthora palmivora]|uniref:Transmembrane protein n=1 Tax=Phytophthora palmivora TaxID=4796 RepID=A0A2P4XJ75_9STRA|nr:Hypothetical protein PHPALM_18643 [Phytophthora palmivora]